ncbi:interferon alpha/beta receptor 2-like [Mixophyes fleayi]|uniref:interferon alpha/beta receptor 2-like n=1 Tax=Mixophyes fleayi TaxID=3061075 RepID=UPI003F4DE8D4
MTTLGVLLHLCHATLLVSAVLQCPENVRLVSENFQHILTWEDPNHVSPVYYNVEYRKDFGPLVSTGDCTNITTRSCDLTKDLGDIHGKYRLIVQIVTDQNISEKCSAPSIVPLSSTVLGPPIVDVVPCDHCINVSVQPPVSYLWSKAEQRHITMLSDDVYPILQYNIALLHSAEVSFYNVEFGMENMIIPNLLPKTNYCVSVDVSASLNLMHSIQSAWKCVITEPNHPHGDNTIIIIVSVIVAVLLLVGILLLLIGLDRAGYIFMGRNFFPKVLKSLPVSDSLFSGSSECSWPTCIAPVEILGKKIELESNQDKVNPCGEGYASRKRLLSNTNSDTGGTVSSGQLPSASSSSEESSGPVAEEEISTALPTAMDMTAVPQGSCSSNTHLPVNVSTKTPNLMFNNSGDFNINLNSVSIAEPEEVWTGCKHEETPKEEPLVLMSPQAAGVTLDTENCRHSPRELSVGGLRMSTLEYGSSEEEEEVSDNNGSDEHFASGYMRR